MTTNPQPPADAPNLESRRSLLKKAAIGGALVAPAVWSAPTLLLHASPAAAQSRGGGQPGPNVVGDPGFNIVNFNP